MTHQTDRATALQTNILCDTILKENCKLILEHEIKFLTPLVGKEVFKNDGSFRAKYPHEKLTFEAAKINAYGFDFWTRTNYYFRNAYNSLFITVTTSVNGGGYDKHGASLNGAQKELRLDICKMDNCTIVSMLPVDTSELDKVYNEADILKAAKEIEQSAKDYEAQVSKVPYQFRDILYIKNIRH